MRLIVNDTIATRISRPKGSTVTILNQSATDVYIDNDYNRLNQSATGDVPQGTKIAANTGFLQIPNFSGEIWVRAQTKTAIEVQ